MRWAFVLIFLLAITSLALVGLVLASVRTDLDAGKASLQRARAALASGRLPDARSAFDEAAGDFAAVSARTNGVLGRVATWVPFLGNDVDVADALGEAGAELTAAGTITVDGLSSLPGGVDALVPRDGAFAIEPLLALGPELQRASARADAALARISDAPGAFLVGPIDEARWDAEVQIRDAAYAFDAAASFVRGFPAFAGADGPKRYLVVAQNPAELRGTGGLWSAYAVLTFDQGRPSFSKVGVTKELQPVDVSEIPPPNPDYPKVYERFGGAASWHNMNMTPDFPSAARAAMANFELAAGQQLDGVIAADPFALRSMLAITGPVTVPGTDVVIDQKNVVDVTTNEAYTLFQGEGTLRKEVLGTVAKDVFARFLSMSGAGIRRIRALADATVAGHLTIYTTNADVQRALEVANLAGRTTTGPGDVVGVTVNNAGGDKIDYYATRNVSLSVRLGGDAEAIETLRVELKNAAPSSGQPRYVIGPAAEGAQAGDQVSLVSATCHEPCPLAEARRDGKPASVESGTELGNHWYRTGILIPAGRTGDLTMVWKTDGVWSGNSAAGSYRLTFLGQTTIRPTTLDLKIVAPAGTQITWTSQPMTIDGGVAMWSGQPQRTSTFEIRFRAPLPLRWWRDLTG